MRKIAFIGVGNMANAIICGILRTGIVDHAHLILSDRFPEKCTPYVQKGALSAFTVAEAAAGADCIVLSVKPQNFPEILPELATVAGIQNKLIITIAAGISTETVQKALLGAPVVRAMPNTPMLIGMGVSALCHTPNVSDEDFAYARSVFEASGSVTVLDESDMNRIISVTGSSPAYVFAFINAIREGAIAQGMDGDGLMESICDVVIGSATLLKTGGLTPEEQIKVVTSKGGTTERAMNVLRERDLTATVVEAMQACTNRAEEMGRSSGN